MQQFQPTSPSTQSVSLETSFVNMFFVALDRLQMCWMDEKGFDRGKFSLQISYLIHLLPDKQKQKEVLRQWNKSHTELEEMNFTDAEKTAYAGMDVVTEIIIFLCQAFDLTHEDIVGPATIKQYQKESLVIPDIPTELVDVPEPEETPSSPELDTEQKDGS